MSCSISRTRGRSLALLGLAFFIAIAWTAPAFAQTAGTGSMIARALDPDGLPLPGATVHLEGPLGTNTQITAVDGNARILGLAPGRVYRPT